MKTLFSILAIALAVGAVQAQETMKEKSAEKQAAKGNVAKTRA